jgi:DNA-binding beta-propeller fold protein YncE
VSCFAIAGKPLGIAVTASRIFVGNETLHTVEVYDHAVRKISDLPGTFSIPASLAADEKTGLLFVLDSGTRTISLLTYTGNPVRTITGDLSGDGKLVHPVAIAVDPVRQEILVSDYGDVSVSFPLYPARVRIYDYNGTFITVISGRTGGFSRPQGLFVNSDHIFVADGMVGQVLLFTRLSITMTEIAGALGSFGDAPGQLMLPLDVLVEPATGDVLVTNNRPRRIERFEKGGLIP